MQLKPDEKVDWFRVIVDLTAHGHTKTTIAAGIGVSGGTVCNWKAGTEPRFRDGVRLLEMWAIATGNSQEVAPRVNRYSWQA